ncbi:hypothetical protein ACQ7HM_04560 [Williamsia sp. MIQD14]|uniref:hypothetical protein n=1 Tax=Williamsia sp. MIQD14 TaxID=3425703 RepID=UPI003DA1BFFE
MSRPVRRRHRHLGAIVAAGVAFGVLHGVAQPAIADAKPGPGTGSTNSNSHRGPNKATPGRTTQGSASSGANRHRGPDKTRPGDTAFNDDHPRVGAEPDRGAHKVRPGDTWSPTAPRDRSRQPTPPRTAPSVAAPPASPRATAPATPAAPAVVPPPAAVPDTPAPPAVPPTSVPAVPVTPRPETTVDASSLRSVESPQGLPSTVAPADENGRTDYTVRYVPGPAEQGPGLPLTRRTDFAAPGNRVSSWGPDPAVGAYGTTFEVGENRMQLPLGTEPDPNVKAAPSRPRGVDVTAKVVTQVRISSATPVGQQQVRDSSGNTWTQVRYRYDYQRRTMYNGGVNSIQVTAPGNWTAITQDEAKKLFDRGIPRPRALGR